MASRSLKSKLVIGLSTLAFTGALAATAYSVEAIRNVTFLSGTFGTLGPTDDGSSGPVDLGFSTNYFGPAPYGTVFVNNNGNVTFGQANPNFDGSSIDPSVPMIAPFFADVDTNQGGTVEFGQAEVDGQQAFVVNWLGVGSFGGTGGNTNSFQLVLTDQGGGNMGVEFNYGNVDWTNGTASGGDANGQPTDDDAVPPFIGIVDPDQDDEGPDGDKIVELEPNGPITDPENDECFEGSTALICNKLPEDDDSVPPGSYELPPLGDDPPSQEVALVTTQVPEPATLALLGAGLVGLGFLRRRRRG